VDDRSFSTYSSRSERTAVSVKRGSHGLETVRARGVTLVSFDESPSSTRT